jgi:serine/threonine protein kinase
MTLSDSALRHLQEVAEMPHFTSDRYTNLRRVGSGGMGTVFCADDTLLGRKVAIKVDCHPVAISAAAHAVTAEAQTVASLEHPGIVPVHDFGTLEDGRVWYAMKFVDGQTLAEIRDSASLPRLLQVMRQTCDAVAFAHSRGVVHRDLKPQNIMVGSFGETLVMDWGVARAMGDGDAIAVGTRGYVAPEQLEGAAPDPRADVYSLGCVLRFILGDAGASSGRDARSPRALTAICAKATAADPRDRYADAAALSNDLARYLEGSAVEAHRESALEVAARWLVNNKAIATLVAAYIVMRVVIYFVS